MKERGDGQGEGEGDGGFRLVGCSERVEDAERSSFFALMVGGVSFGSLLLARIMCGELKFPTFVQPGPKALIQVPPPRKPTRGIHRIP